MTRRPHWRTQLDPRDPDYIEPVQPDDDDDAEPDDNPTDAELDHFAAEAENSWRPTV